MIGLALPFNFVLLMLLKFGGWVTIILITIKSYLMIMLPLPLFLN